MKLRASLEAIEALRGSRVLLLAVTNLDVSLLRAIYRQLRTVSPSERLDVLLYCRGGQVGVARRVGLLLHGCTDRLTFIVPDRCESAGTILALSGREIIAGPLAVFSPVDPLLEGGAGPETGAIMAEDVRLFGEMAQHWFGLDSETARTTALSILSENIFPTTLTAFYRSTLEVEATCSELLLLGYPDVAESVRTEIASKLLRGHHSHSFPLAPADLASLGLQVRCDPAIEEPPYEAIRGLIDGIGPRARKNEDDGWIDALVATSTGWVRRRRSPSVPEPAWESGETE